MCKSISAFTQLHSRILYIWLKLYSFNINSVLLLWSLSGLSGPRLTRPLVLTAHESSVRSSYSVWPLPVSPVSNLATQEGWTSRPHLTMALSSSLGPFSRMVWSILSCKVASSNSTKRQYGKNFLDIQLFFKLA